jgi:hypothetical protein
MEPSARAQQSATAATIIMDQQQLKALLFARRRITLIILLFICYGGLKYGATLNKRGVGAGIKPEDLEKNR